MSFQDVSNNQDCSFAAGVSFDASPLEESHNNPVGEVQQQQQHPSGNADSCLENMDGNSFSGEENPKSRENHLCPFCPKIFSYKSMLDFHMSRFHLNAFSMSSSHRNKIPEANPKRKKISLGFYKKKMWSNIGFQRKRTPTLTLSNFSSFLSTSIQNHSSLNPHVSMRHNITNPADTHSFHCSMCEYKTDHKPTFERHNLKHTISRYECNLCQMPFLRKENLLAHLKSKHSDTNVDVTSPSRPIQLQCPHCQYSTSFKSVMDRHLLKHDLATHTCDICRMPFINKANIFLHMKLKHPSDCAMITNLAERELHQCPLCPYSNPIYSKVTRHIRIQHRRGRFECKVCELFLPSEVALEEHIRQNHSQVNHSIGNNHFELNPQLPFSTDAPTDQCFFCPYCLNRLDTKSLFIHTDVSNYVCPTCNMAFPRQMLIGQNIQAFESKELNLAPDESFSDFPDNTETRQLSDVQLLEEIYIESEDLQNDIGVRSKPDLDNSARHADQTEQRNSIDFIEIDDDDDDVNRIDVDANESLHYPHVLHSSHKDATSIVSTEDMHFPDKDNECDPLMGGSPNKTYSSPGPSTLPDQSNSSSKRGRWVKLVSDFDDFAERPFACALCYQRYPEFKQLSIHVKNHLTGAGGYEGDQTMVSFNC